VLHFSAVAAARLSPASAATSPSSSISPNTWRGFSKSIPPAASPASSPESCSTRLRAAAEKHHLTFAPDPATHDRCTLGGMIGNNSCGVHSVMAGKTDDNIEELEVLTYDGVRMKVGVTSSAELERICAAGGRRAEIYTKLTIHRFRLRRSSPPALSQHSRAASPATT
jgi:hypothetical protein